MSGHVFRASWPLDPGVDTSREGLARLRVAASAQIDALAAEQGVRIVGHVEWRLGLIAEAPALPAEGRAA